MIFLFFFCFFFCRPPCPRVPDPWLSCLVGASVTKNCGPNTAASLTAETHFSVLFSVREFKGGYFMFVTINTAVQCPDI